MKRGISAKTAPEPVQEKMMKKVSMALAVVLLLMVSHTATAGTFTTTFDEFNTGWFFDSSNAANGWYGNGTSGTAGDDPQVDAYIEDLGGAHGKVFRLSNATTSGNYGTTHAAPPELDLAGESATGANNRRFQFSFDFKSASSTVQDGLRIDPTGWDSSTASRHAQLYITDDTTDGFSIGFWDTGAGGSFNWNQLATGLDRDAWHTISVDMLFVDGLANDTVSVTLNGTTTSGLTTWETYYDNAGTPQPEVAGVDNLIFRVASSPVESVRGGGVYFDNLTMSSIPEPASIGLLALISGGIYFVRRFFVA
jgi:hypothetical protein